MRIVANGIGIEVDDQGLPGGEPLLLIMGLGMQLTAWPDELVQQLVSRGFRVIRMDNRDAGLSQGFDQLGVPNVAVQAIRYSVRLPVAAPYRIADMAQDTLGVLDALGLAHAHVCGASMGGMIAQHLAARHPQRVKSLTLMMTTTGSRKLPQPGLRVRHALVSRPRSGGVDDVVAHLEYVLKVIGSPAYPADRQRQRQRLEATVRRAWRPAGTARQIVAVVADGDRSPLLPLITAPTRIIHGEADPLVRVAAGRDLVQRIRGAVADIVPGMGHDLPQPLLPHFAAGIAENAGR
ncbi:MAG: alpha/beta fold hydrolase [Rubrivivax sp.]|nr:alpha/beta fold hydrolase [Rubrivivax sp.]